MSGKYKALLIILAIVAMATAFDYVLMRMHDVTVVSISPNPSPADGKTPIEIVARATRGNHPVSGHDLYAVSMGSGSFKAFRVTTDANGEAVFTYFPYKSTALSPAGDVEVLIRDESISVFIEIYAQTSCTVRLTDPAEEEDTGFSMDDIFG